MVLLISRPTLEPHRVSSPLEMDPSSVMQKLSDLERKVNNLELKLVELPNDKEDLLKASVCRVDALEAELIATKKVSISLHVQYLMKIVVLSIEK